MEANDLSPLEHLALAARTAGVEVEDVVLPETHHAIVRGMRLHYYDWGIEHLPPILFLHGGGLTARTWDVVCLALRKRYWCLALDQRGHGDSEWSPEMDYRPEAHLADVAGFADLLGLERFFLVGQSMGAMNGLVYAAQHSDRLAGLVLIDAGPDVRVDGAKKIQDFVRRTATIDSIDEFVARALVFNPRRDPRLLRASVLHNLRQCTDGTWMRKHDVRGWHDGRAAEVAERARERWKDVPRITCPTLVVRGAESDVFLDEDAEKLAWTLPDGRWRRIERAGHTVQGDNPASLIDALLEFFADVAGKGELQARDGTASA